MNPIHPNRRRTWLLAVGLATFGACHSLLAQVISMNATVDSSNANPHPLSATLHGNGLVSSTTSHDNENAYAKGSGGPGVLRAAAGATVAARMPETPGNSSYLFAAGRVEIEYQDWVTISAPGVAPGTFGTAVVSLWMPGSVGGGTYHLQGYSRNAFANGQVSFQGSVGNDAFGFVEGFRQYEGYGSIPTDAQIPFGFYFDTPFSLSFSLIADAAASASNYREYWSDLPLNSTATVWVDFGNSIYWDGLSDLTAGGNPLAAGGFSVSSTSGTDYSRSYVPTPEPQTWAVVSGLGLVGFTTLRRRPGRMPKEDPCG
ncbi:MAG: hypothetical protein H7A45_04245 [Verrucomicrobiales bacterium]|nr:hypothetical protein [Verrucomicrobiales bacterium]MCP5528449.1 hypothetical protein [Verrucomicrobiales bacterium]